MNTHRKGGSNGSNRPARIPLGKFYSRVDKHGRRYLSGRLGLMRLLLFETAEESQGDRVWEAIIAECYHATDEQRALARELEHESP